MEVLFHIMIDKLNSGVWDRAYLGDEGAYVTLIKRDGRLVLLLHDGEGITSWTLNMSDSLNIRFRRDSV